MQHEKIIKNIAHYICIYYPETLVKAMHFQSIAVE